MKAQYFAQTDVGRERKKNEDAFLLQEVWDGTHLLAVVADGVGGYRGGDVASNLACKCIGEHVNGSPVSLDKAEILHAAVVYANNSIITQQKNPWLSQMKTVLTAVLIDVEGGEMNVCHAGDTRLYMLKDNVLSKITSDHSYVGPMEESGELTEEQAMKHPKRNIITRCLGDSQLQMSTEEYLQTHTLQLKPCTLLLCSDGLYDMVHSTRTKAILSAQETVEERTSQLVQAALDAGGKDNITVCVIDIAQ
ncbi:MAG: serine/threonine-protein phosphatase [Lentimicrobiaceae bacterium]|nr:serine/threonine-protein phosphatase [Lentimicrobiaceae bacterium]